MKKKVLWSFLFCLASFLTAESLLAHDMWLQPTDEGFVIAVGHKGKIDPYAPDRVLEIVGYTENGWRVPAGLAIKKESCVAIPDEDFCALTGLFDNKYWLKTTDGWKNQRDKKGLEVLEEGRSYKYTKHISMWCNFLAQPLGQRFEIVPMKDPTNLKEGDNLPIKVYFEGKPAPVASLSKTTLMDDSHQMEEIKGDGPFMVRIGPPGLQLVKAKYRIDVTGRQVVWLAASLSFTTAR